MSLKTKRVHFAPTNILYSPVPATPSPSNSTSSLPSSSDPPTPPPHEYTPAPPRHASLNPMSECLPDSTNERMQIHFLLAYAPYAEPFVNYDLSLPPSTFGNQIPPQTLLEPATSPALHSLVIECPHLKWDFSITPSSSLPGAFVTVLDVFEALYRGLRLAVHPVDYNELPFDIVRDVNAAYYTRCGRILATEARTSEESKGIKRVDFLMGRTRFLGLSGTTRSRDIWTLNVS